MTRDPARWMALAIGNSRLHWATFVGIRLEAFHHGTYLSPTMGERLLSDPWNATIWSDLLGISLPQAPSELWIASVVPAQTHFWQQLPMAQVIQTAQIPLQGLYPTLGVDRSLALWGAGTLYGYPLLLVDAGTALTLTGADAVPQLVGGAILPGLSLQFQTLAEKTAALPGLSLPAQLPPRWASSTAAAIQSGILYTVTAGLQQFIQDWRRQFPDSQVVLTGGDAALLLAYLAAEDRDHSLGLQLNPDVLFWGMASIRQRSLGSRS